jgi:hypothetical protein
MAFIRRTGLTVVLALAVAAPAVAQAAATPSPERSSNLGVFVGGAATSAHTGPTLSGIAGWQLTRWLAFEGRGSWLRREAGADAFAADLGTVVNVVPSQTVTPFVGAAFGLYRVSFDSPAASASDFYRRRMRALSGIAPRNPTFTDPAFRISAGVEILARRNLTIRPEASAIIVRRGGHGQAIAVFGAKVGYRFEDRPITP